MAGNGWQWTRGSMDVHWCSGALACTHCVCGRSATKEMACGQIRQGWLISLVPHLFGAQQLVPVLLPADPLGFVRPDPSRVIHVRVRDGPSRLMRAEKTHEL